MTLVEGHIVRDWISQPETEVLFPYGRDLAARLESRSAVGRHLWPYKPVLIRRREPGGTHEEIGLTWYEWSRFQRERYRVPLGITFGDIATHNHFVLDRGGKVFNRTAPVIKLLANATEDEHLGLLGLLNSSVACFWLKQVCFPKGGDHVGQEGARVRKTQWDDRYAFNATNVADFPLTDPQPIDLARRLDTLARELTDTLPGALLARGLPTRASLDAARDRAASIRRQMIGLQEELDWHCYRLYDLIDEPLEADKPPEVALGERAFELVVARRMAAGEETTWFARHGSTPITEVPEHWPDDYRRLVARRVRLIESDRNIGLVERPEYKRRWNAASWENLEQAALRSWLLDRLEDPRYWRGDPQLKSVAKLTDAARLDADFIQVAEIYTGRGDYDAAKLVAQLVGSESAPFLPVVRYAESGLRKRAEWEACWARQRLEDVIDARVAMELKREEGESEEDYAKRLATEQRRRKASEVGDIPVPPKYKSSDFLSNTFWRLRGGLDVPKERATHIAPAMPTARWLSPGLAGITCSRPRHSPPITST